MERRAFLASAGSTATLALAGCIGGGRGTYDIGMSASNFLPTEFTCEAGDTVVWQNTGSRGHTVTAYEDAIPDGADYFATGGFEDESSAREAWQTGGDGTIFGGDVFEHTFEVAGTYGYFCIPHEDNGMVGTIEVE